MLCTSGRLESLKTIFCICSKPRRHNEKKGKVSGLPTVPFTILEPFHQEIGKFCVVQDGLMTDLEDAKVWKGRQGQNIGDNELRKVIAGQKKWSRWFFERHAKIRNRFMTGNWPFGHNAGLAISDFGIIIDLRRGFLSTVLLLIKIVVKRSMVKKAHLGIESRFGECRN